MNSGPSQIGVTGGIGAGKSTICKIFKTLKVPVYHTDDRAKWLMNNQEWLKKQIVSKFSKNAYRGQELDRQYLANHVFHQQEQLNLLNSMVHPIVAQDYHQWVRSHQNAPYLIKETALVFETGNHRDMDKVIVVIADEATRIDRVLKRDPERDKVQIKAIMAKQIPVTEATHKADYVLRNDGLSLVLPKVLELHRLFSSKK